MSTIYDDVATLQQEVATLQTQMTTLANVIPNDSDWIDLPLNSGWSMNDYDTEKPQYRKVGKVVMLRGLVNATGEAGNLISTLPAGFRPIGYYNRWSCSLGAGNERANVQVNMSGEIADWNKGTNTRMFLCLNGISFLVD